MQRRGQPDIAVVNPRRYGIPRRQPSQQLIFELPEFGGGPPNFSARKIFQLTKVPPTRFFAPKAYGAPALVPPLPLGFLSVGGLDRNASRLQLGIVRPSEC